MVKKKGQADKNWLTDELDRINRMHPVVATRYYVVEITPPRRYRVGDGHGGSDWEWTNEGKKVVSPYFDEKDDATAWMDEHEADEGKVLAVQKQQKRRTVTEAWW